MSSKANGYVDILLSIRFRKLNEEILSCESSSQGRQNESRFREFFGSIYGTHIINEDFGLLKTPTSICSTDSHDSSEHLKQYNSMTSQPNGDLSKYTVYIEKIINEEDKRTTVMIKNIPAKFTQEMLLDLINQKFKGKFDVFYLPSTVKLKKNYGYAFINFKEIISVVYFYCLFHGMNWKNTNSKKICEVAYANIQGKTDLLKQYPRKRLFIPENINYQPLGKEKDTKNEEVHPKVRTLLHQLVI